MSETPEPSREQFADRVIKIVRARFPLVKIARAGAPFSVLLNGQMASLENLYRVSVLRPAQVQHDVERWAVELLRAGEGSPDDQANYEQVKDRLLPMVLPELQGDPGQHPMLQQPLIAGLNVGYCIDNDRTISYLPRETLDRWKLDLDEIHETAIANLVARSESISAHAAQDEDGRVNLILFQTMDGFDASRILLPTLHERLREYLGSPFAAGIPNRDILLCFRNDEQTVGRLREQIGDDYRKMPHQVTDRLMLITPDGIAPRE